MKKFLMLVLALVLALAVASLAACRSTDDNDDPDPNGNGVETQDPVDPGPGPGDDEVKDDTPADPPGDVPPADDPPPVAIDVQTFPTGVAYMLRLDEDFLSRTVADWGIAGVLTSPFLANAGEPEWGITEAPWHHAYAADFTPALFLENRREGWYALDLVTSVMDWDLSAHDYFVIYTGYLHGSADVSIGGADPPWAGITSAPASGHFAVTHVLRHNEINLGELPEHYRQHMRFSATPGNHLEIFNVAIVRYLPRTVPGAIYQLSTDYTFQSLAVGEWQNANIFSSPFITSAGSAQNEIVAGPYGNALFMEARNESWYALDLITPMIGIAPGSNDYRITVRGRALSPGNQSIGGADPPWAGISGLDVDGVFEHVTYLTAANDLGRRGHLRIGGVPGMDLIIYDVIVERAN